MTAVRKGVLLRLRPEVLDAIDRARGAQSRTEWLTCTILRELDALDEPRESEDEISPEVPPASGREYSKANDANGGSGLDGEPHGDPAELSSLEGPDAGGLAPGDVL